MTVNMVFDALVWAIGTIVVLYMIRRYWVIFKYRNSQEACGSPQNSCGSCKTGCDSKRN